MVDNDKPLAYVLGTQPFHPLPHPLLVRPPTLIPRPETEHWVSLLSSRLLSSSAPSLSSASAPFRLLDIGTGTGCIALSLAHALSSAGRPAHAVAVDRAPSALALAAKNAARQGLAALVDVREADLFAPSFADALTGTGEGQGRFDLVVSNPPYITRAEYAALDASVRAWEDRGALVGEHGGEAAAADDGLVFYRRIVSLLEALLIPPPREARAAPAPVVAFEVGHAQARAVERLLQEWRGAEGAQLETEVVCDPWGVERAVFARWKAS
ncbi:hypothetical protein JCM10450v2_007101 [Rhodotorula kratochvilovae]